MRGFEFAKPATIQEALSLLKDYGGKALPVAGGTDLMPLLKKDAIAPEALISLLGIPELGVFAYDGSLTLGAAVTHRTVEKSAAIRREFSALADAEDVLGSVQIRNVGTVVGNICTAAPSADTAPPLLVLGTGVRVASLAGERIIPLENFFLGPGKTVLADGEVVTGLTIPAPLACSASAYWKHQRRRALDLPMVGVAVHLALDRAEISSPDSLQRNGPLPELFASLEKDRLVCREIRIALGVAAPVPMRAYQAERVLKGRAITCQLVEEAAKTASEEARPRDSIRGEAWYRREMIKVFVQRMVLTCLRRIAEKGKVEKA